MSEKTTEREHGEIIGGDSRVRKPRRWPLFLGGAAACLLLLPFVPALLATSAAPPTTAEAIYVFPGQVPERAECGAALYREGVAPAVVFTGGSVAAELEAVGMPLDDATLNARIAAQHGVPAEAEVLLHAGSSTWEDARVLGRWMEAAQVRRVIAVTSPTHSRRAQYTLWLALGALGQDVAVYRCGSRYGALWWTQERSLVRVTLEALKLGFYTLRYFVPALLGLEPSTETHEETA